MSSAYRSAYEHIVGLRLAETKEVRAELTPLLPSLRAVVRARIARIVAGSVGIAGAAAMTACAVWFRGHDDASPTYALLGSSIALVVVWILMRGGLGVSALLRRKASYDLKLSGQLEEDIARIEATDPRSEVQRIEATAESLELPSIALPIAGISLLAPLLSHWLFVIVCGNETSREFSDWIRISLVIVGHAHIALVICGFLFAKRIKSLSLEGLGDMRIHREWLKAWMITIGVSCLPGILLVLVPPLLVAVTGIAFIPIVWIALHRAVISERSAFAFASATSMVRIARDVATSADALAEQKQREADRHDDDAEGDADDRAERQPLVVAAHRVGDDRRWR